MGAWGGGGERLEDSRDYASSTGHSGPLPGKEDDILPLVMSPGS